MSEPKAPQAGDDENVDSDEANKSSGPELVSEPDTKERRILNITSETREELTGNDLKRHSNPVDSSETGLFATSSDISDLRLSEELGDSAEEVEQAGKRRKQSSETVSEKKYLNLDEAAALPEEKETPRVKIYFSLEDAAAQLGMTTEQLMKTRERCDIRGFADRGSWKFREQDIAEFLRSQQSDSDSGNTLIDSAADVIPPDSDSDANKLASSGSDIQPTGDSDPNLDAESDDDELDLSGWGSDVKLSDSDSDVKLAEDSGIEFEDNNDSGIDLDAEDSEFELAGLDDDDISTPITLPEAKNQVSIGVLSREATYVLRNVNFHSLKPFLALYGLQIFDGQLYRDIAENVADIVNSKKYISDNVDEEDTLLREVHKKLLEEASNPDFDEDGGEFIDYFDAVVRGDRSDDDFVDEDKDDEENATDDDDEELEEDFDNELFKVTMDRSLGVLLPRLRSIQPAVNYRSPETNEAFYSSFAGEEVTDRLVLDYAFIFNDTLNPVCRVLKLPEKPRTFKDIEVDIDAIIAQTTNINEQEDEWNNEPFLSDENFTALQGHMERVRMIIANFKREVIKMRNESSATVEVKNKFGAMKGWMRSVGARVMGRAAGLSSPLQKIKNTAGSAVKGWRKLSDKYAVASGIDTAIRGVTGYVATNSAVSSATYYLGVLGEKGILNRLVAEGGSLVTNVAAPAVGALAGPLAILGIQKLTARIFHSSKTKEEYNKAIDQVVAAVYKDDDEASATLRELLAEHLDQAERFSKKQSAVDTLDEKALAELMVKRGHCKPHEIPYLASEREYIEYCFAHFVQTCKKLADSPQGLTPEEMRVASLFHIEREDKDSPTPEAKEKILHSLFDVSVEYGRLVASEHRKRRNKELFASSVGGSAILAPLLGPSPLIASGLTIGAKMLYDMSRKSKNLEFDSKGKLHVTIKTLKDAEGGLYNDDILSVVDATTSLTHDQKHWADMMEFPKDLKEDRSIHSASDLAVRWQRRVIAILEGKAGPKHEPDKEKIEKLHGKKKEYKEQLSVARQELRTKKLEGERFEASIISVTSRLRKCREKKVREANLTTSLDQANSSLTEMKRKRKTNIQDFDEEEFEALRLRVTSLDNDLRDLRLRDRNVEDEDQLMEELRKFEAEKNSINTEIMPLTDAIKDLEASLKIVTEKINKLEGDDEDDAHGEKKKGISIEELLKNKDILRAFAIRCQQEFAKLHSTKKEAWYKKLNPFSASRVTKVAGGLGGWAADVGDHMLKPSINTALIGTGLSYVAGYSLVSGGIVGAGVGALIGIWRYMGKPSSFFKNLGKDKPATPEPAPVEQAPPASPPTAD